MGEINLLIPGPTPLPPRVLQAMGREMDNHRGPTFGRIMAEILDGLKDVFRTRNDIIPLVCSGTGGLEAAVVNFLSPGDRDSTDLRILRIAWPVWELARHLAPPRGR